MRRAGWACLCLLAAACGAAVKATDLVAHGHVRELRERSKEPASRSARRPALLVLLLDGVGRALLYDLLRAGELPNLARLLGGEGARLPHAHLDQTFLATMPSSTMAAWTTAMTGVPPARHGIAGNEFFVREERRLVAPAPVSFSDAKPTLAIYTDGYLDTLKRTRSVYELMRADDPQLRAWVALHQIFSGADRLLVTKPTVLAKAFEHVIESTVRKVADREEPRKPYARLDDDVVDVVIDELEDGPVPDVLTVYLSGTDLYAHVAREGPDEARRAYLKEVVDPAMGRLHEALRRRGALEDRWVVLTSDHGHTEVPHDEAHALATDDDDDAPQVLARSGFRLRPLRLAVDEDHDFDAVFAAGGATAYVYLADRSSCPRAGARCDWSRPPRYREDVLPAADAYFEAGRIGARVPGMKGTLDLVLTRRPRPHAEDDLPFEVYVGNGRTEAIARYLAHVPHPDYVDLVGRLRDLAVGPRGERAGDVMLIAHNGDRADVARRYYFAARYRSWHGSPSRQDAEIPLIVAHPRSNREAIGRRVAAVLGDTPRQQKLTDLLLELRRDARP